ncbi:class I SAM-dependent methyltransferase [Candidatus Margulisiibacteriota bacterium]
MAKNIICNLCDSADSKLIKSGVFGNEAQNIYQCIKCAHLFLAPLLEDSEEEHFYLNEYPTFLLKRGDTKSISPEEHFIKNKSEAIRRFKYIKKHLTKSKDVLEIGSATGFFLAHLKNKVKSAAGIEPNIDQRNFANKKKIITHENISSLKGKKFDLIFLYYVLEHIKSPVQFMADLQKLLKNSNSKIIFEVPNADEALIKLYRSPAYNNFVWQRAHCSYFTPKTLAPLFKNMGMNVEFVPIQRYDISNHIYWLTEGKPGGTGKYSNIFSEILNKEYRNSLERSWLCDSILAVVTNNK